MDLPSTIIFFQVIPINMPAREKKTAAFAKTDIGTREDSAEAGNNHFDNIILTNSS